jgi:hypothetical protein
MPRTIALLIVMTISFGLLGQTKHPAHLVDSISWKDSEGDKLIRLTLIEQGKMGEKNWDNRISAVAYLKKGDSIYEMNRIKEAASSDLESIDYIKGTIRTINISKEDTLGGYFFYEMSKDGLDDNTLKLICFYGKNKIVVTGNVPKQSERIQMIKYILKGADNLSKGIKDWATAEWSNEANKRMKKYISELE